MVYSRSLLVIHLKYSSVCILTVYFNLRLPNYPFPYPTFFFFLILTCNTCPISASSSCHASCSVGSPLPHTELSHEFINTLWSFLVNLTSSHSLELHLHHRNIFPNPFSSLTSPWLFPVWPSRFQLTSPCSALL